MAHRILADLVVLVHFAFIVFVLLGGLLTLRWRWIPWVHLPAALWGAAVELLAWYCPLTPLENALRRGSGTPGYEMGFVERYLLPVIYPTELTRELQLGLGAVVLGVNGIVYASLWWRWRRRRSRARASRRSSALPQRPD